MKRLYYLTDSVSSVLEIIRDLEAAGIGENRVHVMGENHAVLDEARVHTTTAFEETDLMPYGFTGGMIGLVAGVLVGFLLAMMDPWALELGSMVVLVSAAFFACFGAWMGGIAGISRRNHHLEPYLDRIREGYYLVMVDVDDDDQEGRARRVMEDKHAEAAAAGREDHYSPIA